jgi:2'-5' RNA ligase
MTVAMSSTTTSSASPARYAIYLAPPADSALWRFGSFVLGYDAATGEDIQGFGLPVVPAPVWHLQTARPRTYGFHATLKAPFRLAPDKTLEHLKSELRIFAASRAPFDLGPLAVTSLGGSDGGFAALTLQRDCPALVALEADVVMLFDRFRAPLTTQEFAARKPERLSARERLHLEAWGYAHVLDDFRFHMTLSGHVANPDDVADALADALANTVGTAHMTISELVLFEQPEPDARFRIVARAPMAESPEILR